MAQSQYQVAVIGGGPGGYVAAIRAAQLGLSVVVIEKHKALGGTCLNVGCIPSKALLASSEHYHFAKEKFAAHGIIAKDLSIDLSVLMKRKDAVVSKNAKGIDFLFKKNKVDRILGTGTLVDATTIEVDAAGVKSTIKAEKIILATGSVPIELPFMKFDGKRVISSDQAIALGDVPKSMVIIGGGAIGLELGSVWSRLGTQVTVLEFLPRIAAGSDIEVSNALKKSLTAQGLVIHVNTKVQAAKVTTRSVTLDAIRENVQTNFEAEIVLVAVGRKPFTIGLGLEAAGVQLTDKGRIRVDGHGVTSVPNIYAIGDVTDGPMLAHKAEEEGVAVAERIAGKPGHVNYDVIPNVIYTTPEAASVGLSEEQAKERGIEYKTGSFPLMANGRALATDTADGFVKIIADAKTDRVLGVHIVSAVASELIAEAVTLMEFSGSAEDLARTVHAHPTVSEAVKEAALAVAGRSIHS